MRNSKLAASCRLPTTSEAYPMPGANGILARVQGHHVSAALQTLGLATRNASSHHEVLVEAGHPGTVRLFIEKKLAHHDRHSHYYWSAYRAEPAEGQ